MRFTANALGRRTRSGRRSWAIYPILREAISGHSACGRAEHFACALAMGPVRIGRMGQLSEELPQGLLETCAKILLYGADAEIYNLPCEQPDLSEEAVSQLSDQADESGEITVPVSEQPGTTKASETPVRPAADRKIVSFQKRQRRCIDLTQQPAEVKKSGGGEDLYRAGHGGCGDRSVLAPMPIVTDTESTL